MADRQVKCTGKNTNGTITSIGNRSEAWSPRSEAEAISDIEKELHTYFVNEGGEKTVVRVVAGPTRKYLETTSDKTKPNNLGKLPDC